jgi:hypothetical protein
MPAPRPALPAIAPMMAPPPRADRGANRGECVLPCIRRARRYDAARTASTSSETSCRSPDSPAGGHTELSETSQAVFWDRDLNSAVRCRCSQKGHGRRDYAGLPLHQAHCHVLIATWHPAIEDLLLLGRTYSRWSLHRANRLVQASNRQQVKHPLKDCSTKEDLKANFSYASQRPLAGTLICSWADRHS